MTKKITENKEVSAEEKAVMAFEETTPENENAKLFETVKINLFCDNDKYGGDVYAAVNGRGYLIKRGETVEVPAFIADVLERAGAQRRAAEYYRDEGWKSGRIIQEGKV